MQQDSKRHPDNAALLRVMEIESLLWEKFENLKAYVKAESNPNLVYIYCEMDNIQKLREQLNAARYPNVKVGDTVSIQSG
jgi:hypothetical protein